MYQSYLDINESVPVLDPEAGKETYAGLGLQPRF